MSDHHVPDLPPTDDTDLNGNGSTESVGTGSSASMDRRDAVKAVK